MNPKTPFERDLAKQRFGVRHRRSTVVDLPPVDLDTCEFTVVTTPNLHASIPAVGKPAFDETTAGDEDLKAHFAATPALRDSFSGPDAYVSFIRNGGDDSEVLAENNRVLQREIREAERRLAGVNV